MLAFVSPQHSEGGGLVVDITQRMSSASWRREQLDY
jgi:hypothetical protein